MTHAHVNLSDRIQQDIIKWQNKRAQIHQDLGKQRWTEEDKLNYQHIIDGYRNFGIENASIIMDRLQTQLHRSAVDVQVGILF